MSTLVLGGGSNLLADSRLAVSFVFHVGYLGCVWGDAIITPDGSAVVCGPVGGPVGTSGAVSGVNGPRYQA